MWHLKKKNSQVKIRLFACPWSVGPSRLVFEPGASCTTSSSPLLCVLRQATTSPSPLRLHGALCSFQEVSQALRVLIHLCSLSCSLSKLWGPWALWGGTSPLSSQRIWSARVRAKLPSIMSISSWDRLRVNTQNRTGPLNLITWITPSFAKWLFNAFLELNFGTSLKLGHGKVIGIKMTAWYCHGSCVVPL